MFLLLTGLLLLATPAAGQALPATPASLLSADARARLVTAARDANAEPWQREFMLRLAREGVEAATAAPSAQQRPAVSQRMEQGGEDGTWVPAPQPTARFCHTAIYDPVRQRMVIFGGYDGGFRNDVWALSLAGTPVWSEITPSGTPPTPRNVHTAIYDPVRDRMIVCGGYDVTGAYLSDVWALTLSGSPAWTHPIPTGTPPSGRGWHSAVYDPIRDRMLVYGGRNAPTINGDVWSLKLSGTPAWTQLAPSGTTPPVRFSHAAIYDPVRDRMVIFAGDGGSGYRNDLWAMTLSGSPAWSQLTVTGTLPSHRPGHAAVYDAVCDRMVVFGGYDGGNFLNDVWGLTLSGSPSCSDLNATGEPLVRGWHTAIYDPVRGGLVTFGGEHSPFVPLKDVWTLSLTGSPNWTPLSLGGGDWPGGRVASAGVIDPLRHRMLVFGGGSGAGNHNDVWSLSLPGVPSWFPVATAGTPPPQRRDHTVIFDALRERMVVFGGRNGNVRYNDVWALSLSEETPTWTHILPAGPLPPARFSHTAIYDPIRDRMVVFGGTDSLGRFQDTWALTFSAPAWVDITPECPTPSARIGHSAIYDPDADAMVVFGGSDTTLVNDVWALPLTDDAEWSELTPAGSAPDVRGWHSAVYDLGRHRMVVLGGWDGTYRNDAWSLALDGSPAWSELSPAGGLPPGRLSHVAVYDWGRDQMVVFGGDDGTTFREDLWLLTWGSPGPVSVPGHPGTLSGRFELSPPRPTPSRGPMTLGFSLEQPSRVVLEVFDAQGRRVRQITDAWFPAGPHTLAWQGDDANGRALGTGVYFIRMQSGGFKAARRAMLIR